MTQEEYKEYLKSKTKEAKPTKYKNTKITVDGKTFDSKKESEYYGGLKLKMKNGLILGFKMQVRYKIIINNNHVCTYVADFVVIDIYNKEHVIDVKSDFTRKLPTYRIKKKLMKAVLNINVKEV